MSHRLLFALALAFAATACTVEEDRPDAGGRPVTDAGTDPTDGGDETDGGDGTDGGTTPENTDALCSDGVSNDGNNFTDCADFSCRLGIDVTVCGTPPIRTVTVEDLQKEPRGAGQPTPSVRNDPAKVTKIELGEVVVTSEPFLTSGNLSFFVAEKTATAEAWKGIFVYAPGLTTTVAVGDVVTLKGTYEEFNGGSQVVAQRIEKTGTAEVPAALAIDATAFADAATSEAYEGVLVKLTDARVTAIDQPTGPSGISDDFEVQIGDKKVLVGALLFEDLEMPAASDWFDSISGVLHFTYTKFRLQPRSAADLVKGEAPEGDADFDGVLDEADNCPSIVNPQQENSDGDDVGDACDVCPSTDDAEQLDGDADGVGNACDNCAEAANADQKDLDEDESGDVCDDDLDGDTVANGEDNCPNVSNTDQADDDENGKGNVCEVGPERAPVAGDLVINELLADPAGGGPTSPDNAKGDANGDGTRSSRGDEFVELVNPTEDVILLEGVELWTRGSSNSSNPLTKRYTFAAGTKLQPGKAAVVFGGGVPVGTFGGSLVVAVSTAADPATEDPAVHLANGGDKVQVKLGETVITEIEYDNTAAKLDDQSRQRNPDITGDFAGHLTVNANANQSPGTKADGTEF